MKYLIDTHIFIWWVVGDFRLSKKAIKILLDPNNVIIVSAVSSWEMAIKKASRKLKHRRSFDEYFQATRFDGLPIKFEHIACLESLPKIHGDPFDRILITQAKFEKLILITDDSIIKKYGIKTV